MLPLPVTTGLRQSELRFHALCQTQATHLLADGELVHNVARRLGHSSAKMTLDVCGHVMPDAVSGLIARLEAMYA